MNNYETDYLNLLSDVLSNGRKSSNRTGINTRKVWGRQNRIDLSQGFPLLITKKIHWKSVVHELLWMINGDTNIRYLLQNGVTFWTEWPYQSYLKHYEENGMAICTEGGTFYGVDVGARSHRPFTQKEFEKRIVENENFAFQFGSVGNFAYGGLWRRFPCYDNSDPMGHNKNPQDPFGTEWDVHYETSCGFSCEVGHVDQLTAALNDLKTNPDSRRIIISAWHPFHSNRKEDAVLPACHNYIQFGTEELTVSEREVLLHKHLGITDGRHRCADVPLYQVCDQMNIPKYRLNCYYSMRSNDLFLGKPYNDAFYALLTHLVANQLNMVVGTMVASIADLHLYENHVEQARTQLARTCGELPKVVIKTTGKSIFDIKFEDIELIGYIPQEVIKASVAV